ncbi:EexN family lipoprotein (plasmid) [Guyparkeria sp. 1SP6A2]|nr:EexN family lipoprotein [Guyparkeria sp. 1SP6A2]
MMKQTWMAALIVAAAALAGCGEEERSMEFYQKNADARAAKLAECGESMQSTNCDYARAAEKHIQRVKESAGDKDETAKKMEGWDPLGSLNGDKESE